MSEVWGHTHQCVKMTQQRSIALAVMDDQRVKADGAAGSGAAEVILFSWGMSPPSWGSASSVKQGAQLWSKRRSRSDVLKAPWSKLAFLDSPTCLSTADAWKQLVIPDQTRWTSHVRHHSLTLALHAIFDTVERHFDKITRKLDRFLLSTHSGSEWPQPGTTQTEAWWIPPSPRRQTSNKAQRLKGRHALLDQSGFLNEAQIRL